MGITKNFNMKESSIHRRFSTDREGYIEVFGFSYACQGLPIPILVVKTCRRNAVGPGEIDAHSAVSIKPAPN